MFDAVSGGTQIGSTLSDLPVTATNGIFTVSLDFGSSPFSGASRWLEIAVRRNSGESYVSLTPREILTSAPYSVRTLSAALADGLSPACVACVTDQNIDSVAGIKVTGSVANATNAANLANLPPTRFVQSDVNGNVGIGATAASGSLLTVGGRIESKQGGIKFPDTTVQTSAGIASVSATSPLTGNGTPASPLGIATPLIIRDIDRAGSEPFFAAISQSGNLVTVPAGKTLVIEFLTATQRVATINGLPLILISSTGPSHYIPPKTWTDDGSFRYWHYAELVKMYFTTGTQVQVFFNGAHTGAAISVQGYYLNNP